MPETSFNVGIQDKILVDWCKDKEYFDCSDEGEAVAIGAGYFLATGKRANVFMSADGLCNAMNFLTSWIIPEGIEMNLIISTGRQENPHKVMTKILPELLELLDYDYKKINIQVIEKDAT